MGQCYSKNREERYRPNEKVNGTADQELSTENVQRKAKPKEHENTQAEPVKPQNKADTDEIKDRNIRPVERVENGNPVVGKTDVSVKPDKDNASSSIPPSDKPSKPTKGTNKHHRRKKKVAGSSSDSSSGSSDSSESSYAVKKKTKRTGDTTVHSTTKSKTVVKGNQYIIDNRGGTYTQTFINGKRAADDKYSGFRYNHDEAKQEEQRQMAGLGTGRGCFINLRKMHLARENVFNLQVRAEVSSWVGILKLQNLSGTCFRVGANKIMTALHVFKKMLELDYQSVHHGRVSDLFEGHGQEETGYNSQVQAHTSAFARVSTYAFVDFGYLLDDVHQPNERDVYKLRPLISLGEVPFFDIETDCIVLEILPNDQGNPMPRQFSFFSFPKLDEGFHLIGHPDGSKKTCDQIDTFIDPGKEKTKRFIHTIQRESRNLLRRNGIDCSFDDEKKILSTKRFLFHCTFGKGASGSPGFLVDDEGRAIVLTMLLHGYPDWYYDERSGRFRNEWPKGNCIEQGVSMISVYDAMRLKNSILCDEIFPHQLLTDDMIKI